MLRSTSATDSADGDAAGLRRSLEELRAGVEATRLPPHFMLNSLHVVAVLLRKGEDAAATGALESLASLMRYVVRTGKRETVRLVEELRFVRDYVELERLRFRRDPVLDVDAGVRARAARVPAMVLQPLVENSLRHGPAGDLEPVRIILRARVSGGTLVVEVSDDGRGFPPGWDPESDMGTGLRGVRAQIRLASAGSGRLEFHRSRTGGARVVARLPGALPGREGKGGGG